MKHKICVVGLGYVGLPLALELAKHFETFGFDISQKRIEELQNNNDSTAEIPEQDLRSSSITYTFDPTIISTCSIIIVAVPTPITDDHKPDLSFLESASKLVGKHLSKGSIVVFESTVYPGATEEVCVPILSNESNLSYGSDFSVGYSPERINPGDREHTIDKIVKIVSASDEQSLATLSEVYGAICKAGIHKAPTIKVAEAAKVIENIQRDLNIALMNELSLIFEKMDIDTKSVIDAAATKWNFARYLPGLVGGHCIGVDPYYLTHKAQELGHLPKVILAGRGINNFMPIHLANYIINYLQSTGKKPEQSTVLIMGLSFKENVSDIRNSKAYELSQHLKESNISVLGHDPLVDASLAQHELHLELTPFESVNNVDAIVIFSPHNVFKSISLSQLYEKCNTQPLLVDIKGMYAPKDAQEVGFAYKTL